MMKILLYGKHKDEVVDLVKRIGFNIVNKNPDVIASYGGDGTFMKCEREYPGIPKFFLKGSKVCKKCSNFDNDEILKKIISGSFDKTEEIKLQAKAKGKKIVGLNEIIVHNKDPRKAIRYEIFVDGRKIGNEIIGDGVVASTPFGSTGYYRSITDSFFEVGIGIAFNNSTEQSDHMVLKEKSEILIKIIRGIALVYADNSEEEIKLDDGDEVRISVSKEKAIILQPK